MGGIIETVAENNARKREIPSQLLDVNATNIRKSS
jgi:hypothetical protein